MISTGAGTTIQLKNILYLTDFSEASEAALPFASAIARRYGAKVLVCHVLMVPAEVPNLASISLFEYEPTELPTAAFDAWEQGIRDGIQRVEAQLSGLPCEALVERDVDVWPAVERILGEWEIGLIVLGTHGRTGAQRLLLGSVAEEIFRRSPVPVLTIGPSVRMGAHSDAQFHRVLFATDFTSESLAAASYAFSFAEENQAKLILLHVIRHLNRQAESTAGKGSAAEAMQMLHDLIPEEAELWCRPHAIVEYGKPAEQILECARQFNADLLVLGVRSVDHLAAATHLKRAIAHNVVAHAPCPVLTARHCSRCVS
jgi:nucleotide-binding universal stress UspA family protein